MDKKEVLEKSRMSKQDEGKEHTENKGRKIGIKISALIYIFIALFSFFQGEDATFYAVTAVFQGILLGDVYGQYKFEKTNFSIFGMIGIGASIIIFIGLFISKSLGS